MARTTFRAAACTIILSAWSLNSAFAQSETESRQASPASAPASQAAPEAAAGKQAPAHDRSVQPAGYHAGVVVHHPGPIPAPRYLPPYAPNIVPCQYPYLNASLYPCPVPYVPYQTGGALITNQAFDPHEMLYPHTYRSLYPPYYYEVTGGWKVLPWGVAQGERWRLRGTYVSVKYHSSCGLFSGWCPPAISTRGNPPIFQTWTGHRWNAD
jgi:hypothetical protein